jgi:ElaB/YqjD/DUF883 family membrane-anchored ribosome-binding protein
VSDELAEVEKSRESAARLLENLARQVGGSQRAPHHGLALSMRDVAAGVQRAVRSRPVSAMAIAAVAGFLVARALRSR